MRARENKTRYAGEFTADSMKHKERRGSYSMLISFAIDTYGTSIVSRRLFAMMTEVTSSSSSLVVSGRARQVRYVEAD